MKSLKSLFLIVATSSLMLTGCATDKAMINNQGQVEQVKFGILQSVRPTMVNVSNVSGLGLVSGAVVGGVLGNQIGGGSGKKWARVLGAVAGGVVGNTIESQNSQRSVPGYDLEVYTDEGQFIHIIQTDTGQGFRSGTRVRLVQQNGQIVVAY